MTAHADPEAEETVAHVRATICANPRDTRIAVDGLDVTERLAGVRIEQTPRGLPTVILEITPQPGQDPVVELDGLAKVYIGEQADPGPAAAAFLAAIDAEQLEKAALNRHDLGGDQYDLTRAMLAQLVEWASGRA